MPVEEKITTARLCLECGEKLGPGREDRKYCDDACRTSYNNRKRKEKVLSQNNDAAETPLNAADYISRIQDILLANRKLLAQLCPGDDAIKMQKRDLEGRGFNFKYFTSESPAKNKNTYRFCFEFGYREIGDGEIIIVHREREIIC